ncbi:hypothetical protein MLD38_015457 [Melastoma candidum]|uniref:Uncharacterized protein n=1 Tax=Melastoma candidum TaxID=119954 RepID=A0ACB9RGS2_9MYRT|nr:hypothetical protein MLD38_015457 [Melastoma candidum]
MPCLSSVLSSFFAIVDPRSFPPLLICLALAIVLSATCRRRKIQENERKDEAPLPPGPRGFPVVGFLPFLVPNLHQCFMQLARVHGPIFKLWIGTKLYVIISSPLLAKQVVQDFDATFANREPNAAARVFSYGGKDIGFAPYGAQWKTLRKIFVREMQSPWNLDALYVHRQVELAKRIEEIEGKVGTPIDVGDLAFRTVINMISRMFWGGTLDEHRAVQIGDEFREAVMRLMTIIGKPNVSDFFPVLARFDVQGIERDMKEVVSWMGEIFEFAIDRRIANAGKAKGGRDFMKILLDYEDEETGRSFSLEQIKALLMDVVVGGTGTTTTIIVWTMTELMVNPFALRRVQAELSEVVGLDNAVEESHVPRLTYLHAVVKETLRLHPAAPLLLPRSPIETCNVGGYAIPKGAKVFLNVWVMHIDPEYWVDPLAFHPERFLREGMISADYKGGCPFYMPFGAGRRICAGLALGERMLTYIIATFLHLFEWEPPHGRTVDLSERLGVVLEKLTPLVAVPRIRVHHSEKQEVGE